MIRKKDAILSRSLLQMQLERIIPAHNLFLILSQPKLFKLVINIRSSWRPFSRLVWWAQTFETVLKSMYHECSKTARNMFEYIMQNIRNCFEKVSHEFWRDSYEIWFFETITFIWATSTFIWETITSIRGNDHFQNSRILPLFSGILRFFWYEDGVVFGPCSPRLQA